MKSMRQKERVSKDMALFFLEQGKVLTIKEYRSLNPVPYSYSDLYSMFGSWGKLLNFVKRFAPEEWSKLEQPKRDNAFAAAYAPKPVQLEVEEKSEPKDEDPLAALAKKAEVDEDE